MKGRLAVVALVILCGALTLFAAEPQPTSQATTTTLKDGTIVTTNADGSKTSQYEPGSRYTQHTDGSRTIEETRRTPDGKSVKTKTNYKPDGTRTTDYPDDPTKPPVEEKPVATRTGRKGQKEYTYKDGTVVKFKEETFQIEKHDGRETTEYKYDQEGGRKIAVHYKFMSAAPFDSGAKVVTLIDNRPDYNVCVAGNPNMTELQNSFYGKFKSLDFSLKSLGSISGYGHAFSTNAPMNDYNDWLQSSGNLPCEGFDAELNFCTLMAPLTAFRGHDHEHHHGGLHSHDSPDPPLSWGRSPPRIVVRLDRGSASQLIRK